MLTVAPPPPTNQKDTEKEPVYSLVVIYEGVDSGKRANYFCESLMREIGEATLFTKDLWSFKVLDIPQVRHTAAEVAAVADVVVLALDGNTKLPDGVKAWMEEWVKRVGDENPILIALFNPSDVGQETGASTRAFFSAVAETAGLTFLHMPGQTITEDGLSA